MKIFAAIVSYLRSSVAELKKVSWPSRQDTLRYGLLVVVVSSVLAVFFVVLDFGLSKLVDAGLSSRQATPTAVEQPVQPDVSVTPATSTETPKLDFSEDSTPITPAP
ncbi:preprotein translocase subunit SecE [Candidatus Uhrbacteria bacterium]|nr:preprotein translocase subunit SecE [Candidatus Uhrbacteria bacterium]